MYKRILTVLILSVLVSGSALANGFVHTTAMIGDTGDYSVYDAAFLTNGELLIIGSRSGSWDGDTGTRPWGVMVDPWSGEVHQSLVMDGVDDMDDAYGFVAVESHKDGFVVCLEGWGKSYLVFGDAQGNMGEPVPLDAYSPGFFSYEDGLVAVGRTDDGAPWAAIMNSNGEVVQQYTGEPTGEQLSWFTCGTATPDGFLLGGGSPDGGLLTKLDLNGHPVWSKQGIELGSIGHVNDIILDVDRIVLAGNIYDPSTGVFSGVMTSLSEDGELLAESNPDLSGWDFEDSYFRGAYLQKSGQGYTFYGSVARDLKNSLDPTDNYTFLYLTDRALHYRAQYQHQVGSNGRAIKVLRAADDTVWVIGHGNFVSLGFMDEPGESNDKKVYVEYIVFDMLDAR